MLTKEQVLEVVSSVHNAFHAFITGNGLPDTFALVAAAGSAILAKGADPTADLAALQALESNKEEILKQNAIVQAHAAKLKELLAAQASAKAAK